HVRFVNQRRGLERMVDALASHVTGRYAVEFTINDVQELAFGLPVARLQPLQQLSDPFGRMPHTRLAVRSKHAKHRRSRQGCSISVSASDRESADRRYRFRPRLAGRRV